MPKQKKQTQQKVVKAKTRGGSRKSVTKADQTAIDQTETQSKLVRQKPECLEDLLKDTPIYVNSVASGLMGLDRGSVLREMQNARADMLRFYMSERGGSVPIEEAIKTVNGPEDEEYTEKLISQLLSNSVEHVSWYGLERLHNRSPKTAKKVWQYLKDEARSEFESGHRAAAVFEPVHWLKEAWRRAQYFGIRDSFIEQWGPQGGIELAMIDMLTQSFYLYLYWNEVSVKRTETEVRADPPAWIKEVAQRDREFPRERGHGYWNPPYAQEQEAVEHAAQMADRYHRAFQRTLRAMRDLRRYTTPVTINNPQQVNIAADGGQQVNIAKDDATK